MRDYIILLVFILLNLKMFQFKIAKHISIEHLLIFIISFYFIDKYVLKTKKENFGTGSETNTVNVDGSTVNIDTESFRNLNKIVKALAAEGEHNVPANKVKFTGDVEIDGNLIINGNQRINGTRLDAPGMGFRFSKGEGAKTDLQLTHGTDDQAFTIFGANNKEVAVRIPQPCRLMVDIIWSYRYIRTIIHNPEFRSSGREEGATMVFWDWASRPITGLPLERNGHYIVSLGPELPAHQRLP